MDTPISVCECGHALGTHIDPYACRSQPGECPTPWRHKHGCGGSGCECNRYRFKYETFTPWIDRQSGLR